ncbi:hypothetical protein BBP40_000146 [Aspergillus hancockii]|nr:hypothetical protein BBP40_000146 [Aspergillus hancockii]
MAPTDNRPPLNPTVEEVKDTDSPDTKSTTPNVAQHPISWPEICSKHESILASHIDMLNSVQHNFKSSDQVFQTISTMIQKTKSLATQFRVVETHLMSNQKTFEQNGSQGSVGQNDAPEWTSSDRESKRQRSRLTEKRKRSRMDTDSMELESENTEAVHTGAIQYHKRKRLDMNIPGDDEDVRNVTPTALETEDISEEVQRRLKIQEEQRRKRNAKPEKRKRDSMASTGSTSSPGTVAKLKKKAKVGTSLDSTVDVSWAASRGKKNLRSHGSEKTSDFSLFEEARRTKRQKRKSGTPTAL